MDYNNIPQELRTLKQWSVYRTYLDKAENKYKKVIISPITGKFAKSDTPATWSDFDTAASFAKKNKYQGITFALGEGMTFIDIDHAIDKNTGEILSQEAKALLEIFPETFAETSVSGTGIHILLYGELPENALKRNDKKGLEMYSHRRFMCMTGNLVDPHRTEVKNYSDAIGKVNEQYIGKREEYKVTRSECSFDDRELIDKIRASRIGDRFDRLYSGDFDGAESHSSADFALCSLLAWWTQDASQIDRIFRSSGLYRPKWDARRGGDSRENMPVACFQPKREAEATRARRPNSTYGSITVESALRRLQSSYSPTKRKTVRFADYEM